jgi:solute carrier family 25 phosphate transporter 23/24/25/41
MLASMDRDGDGFISYEEFMTFYFLVPAKKIHSSFSYWSRSSSFDIGDSVTVPDDHKKSSKTSAWVTLVCGAVAGAVSRTSTAPLDRLKVIMQAQTTGNMTISEGFKGIYKDGGAKSFFRGNGTNVIKIAPETAIKFICYDKIKERVCKDVRAPTTVERLISGAAAGFTAQSLIYPLEICKTRLALAP